MKIFVNGCGGLVGRRLISRLSEDHEVAGYSLERIDNPPEGVECVQGDVSEITTIFDIMRRFNPDVIIHNAAVSHPMLFVDNPARILRINVNGTVNTLEAARQFGVKRFVYISSGAVYGECHLDVVPETTPMRANSMYGASKVACEEIVRNYGIAAVSLRLGYIYGPGRVLACPIQKLLNDLIERNEAVWENGLDQDMDYIYIDDVVDGIIKAAITANSHHAEYNIGGGVKTPFSDVVKAARKLFPDAIIKIGKGTLGYDALGAMDINRAKQDFGWEPKTSLYDGMKAYTEYIKLSNARIL